MSEMSIRGWIRRTSLRARLGTVAVVVGLLAATGTVWLSPATKVTPQQSEAEKQLAAENAKLRASLDARQKELDALRASDAKAAAERAAGEASGEQKAAAEKAEAQEQARLKAAAEQQAAEQRAKDKAAAERAAGAARGATKASLEKALAVAAGKAEGADDRADALERQLAEAKAKLEAANAGSPAAAQPAAKPTAPSKAELLQPANRLFGLYTTQSPFNWAEYDDVTSKVGVTPNVAGYFQGWDGAFRADAVTRSWAKGALPLLTWESRPLQAANNEVEDPDYSLPTILSGTYDDYLRQYARDITALGLPVAIRLDHEMNGDWYPWAERDWDGNSLNGNHDGDYVAMWRHVHDIFQAEGANQYVIWVWAPNIVNRLPDWAQDPSYLASLYPGDGYVDWVGLSGYYRPPYASDQTPTFDYTYGRSLDQLRSVSAKPILLAEVGASEVGGKKPAWVKDFFAGLADPANADVIGFAWFNEVVTTITGGERVTNDWRIVSRSDSLQAFVDGIHDPAAGYVAAPAAAEPTAAAAPAAATAPVALAALAAPQPTATPTPTPTPTPEPAEPAPAPTATPEPTATASPDPTPTPTSTPASRRSRP